MYFFYCDFDLADVFYELIASRVRVNFGLSALGQSLRHWLLGGSESLNEWQCSNISLTSK